MTAQFLAENKKDNKRISSMAHPEELAGSGSSRKKRKQADASKYSSAVHENAGLALKKRQDMHPKSRRKFICNELSATTLIRRN
jgi:hypothetical protein